LLWQEYRAVHPEGYGYSRFCELYHRWAGTLDPVLRQVHLPGEKMFVDWAGQTVAIHNAQDGTIAQAQLFVAVLGASNKTYAEGFPDQKLESWISAHCHAYAFFHGVARVTVPDNLKTGVVRPCRYEPGIHQSYQEMAQHYGTVIIPARVRKPRDKSKVETAVQIAERQILAVLRDQRFFSVGELNAAMAPLLAKLNTKPFQKLEGSRESWFESLEKPKLLPLPAAPLMDLERKPWSGDSIEKCSDQDAQRLYGRLGLPAFARAKTRSDRSVARFLMGGVPSQLPNHRTYRNREKLSQQRSGGAGLSGWF
jgi:transposase